VAKNAWLSYNERHSPFLSSFSVILNKEDSMPAQGKKKCTTPNVLDSTQQGQSAPALPEQDAFRQHLRELARGAIRVVLEDVMREELDALIGVGS
jgi:hypothetical protein